MLSHKHLAVVVFRDGSVNGPAGIGAIPLPRESKPFCITVGPLCIPGNLGFETSLSYSLNYDVQSSDYSSDIEVAHEYMTNGSLKAGVLWRNDVGSEFVREVRCTYD